jgi:hypothetical protein
LCATAAWPAVRIRPEIVTVAPALIENICWVLFPLSVKPLYVVWLCRSLSRRALAVTPGPATDTAVVIVIGVLKTIVEPAGNKNMIVSPLLAAPMAYRNEPTPESAVMLTTGPSVIAGVLALPATMLTVAVP